MRPIDAVDVRVDDVFALGLADVAAGDGEDAAFDHWLASVSPSEFEHILSDLAIDHVGKPSTLNRSA